ncbi:MAG: PilZ domain-containing protein [Candidatus Omnitrophota bacterium]|nr:PilZ domain-containing protein [Candidatus Omnitrophota bacterium]
MERRSAPRIRAYRPVRLTPPGSRHVIETLTKDLSVGGLCCVSGIPLPVATELLVELMLSTGAEPVTARARTAWFRAIPNSEQFDLAVAFTEIEEETKRRLSMYLDHLSKISPLINV